MNRVVEGLDGVRVGIHICRGNWSQNEQVLLKGSYHPLLPYLKRMNVRQLVLEFATPRAGGLEAVAEVLEKKELGLGQIHIILLTAKGQEFDRQRGQEVGADLYMTKPFDPDALLEKARSVLGL